MTFLSTVGQFNRGAHQPVTFSNPIVRRFRVFESLLETTDVPHSFIVDVGDSTFDLYFTSTTSIGDAFQIDVYKVGTGGAEDATPGAAATPIGSITGANIKAGSEVYDPHDLTTQIGVTATVSNLQTLDSGEYMWVITAGTPSSNAVGIDIKKG